MNILIAILSAVFFSFQNITMRAFQLHFQRNNRDIKLFQGVLCLSGSALYFVFSGFTFDLDLKSILLALAFGLFFALASLSASVCYYCGPMSITGVIANASVLIPVIYGVAFLRESITAWQIVGGILLAAVFVLSAFGGKGSDGKFNVLWLTFVILAFFSNGFSAVVQKGFKLASPTSNGNMFMALAYFFAALIFAVAYACDRNQPPNGSKIKRLPIAVIFMCLGGFGSFFGNLILLNLSTVLPGAVLYPIVNGSLCVFTALISCVVFGERFTKVRLLTVIVGVASLVALNL